MIEPQSPWERDERRSARIRRLREEREAPLRRRRTFQPLVLIAWFAAVIALVGVLLFVGFNTIFAPRLMAWVQDNPGAIEHGIISDFVEWYEPGALADDPASSEQQRVGFEVPLGATDTEIGELLFAEGLVHSRLAFQYAVIQGDRSGTLAAGTYDLSPDMRPSQIVAALRGEDREAITVAFREGLRLEEIVAVLADTELTMSIDQFNELVRHPPADLLNQYEFLNDLPAGASLEGYLYPASYEIFLNESPLEVLTRLLDTFDRELTPEIREGIAAQGLTIDEAIRLASIVEREAVIEEERPLIAGVYLNRVQNPDNSEHNGRLNADPTLQYGLATAEFGSAPISQWGSITWWPQLQVGGGDVELPEALAGYQTYRNPGLPPTPIAAPRISSIAAVAFPNTEAGYIYFTAGCPGGVRDGSHYFATTNAEQEANTAQAIAECPAP